MKDGQHWYNILLRRKKIAVFYGAALLLSSCMILPISSKYFQRKSYNAIPLRTLESGDVAYLLQECRTLEDKQGKKSQGCENPLSSVIVRPKEWNMRDEVDNLLGLLPQDMSPILGTGSSLFGRAASASQGDSGTFVGYFVGDWQIDFVWARTKPIGPSTSAQVNPKAAYDVVKLERVKKQPFAPVLVVRDEANAWLFAKRGGPCNEDLCYVIAEVLGVDEEQLPVELREPFMLYHASLSGPNKQFQRVLPKKLASYLKKTIGLVPPSGETYAFDLSGVERKRIASNRSEIICEIEEKNTQQYLFVGTYPASLQGSSSSSRFKGCSPVQSKSTESEPMGLIPYPIDGLPDRERDDPRITRDHSSYYCWQEDIAGKQQLGKGDHGCYFVLHDSKTGRVLPRTPYLIWLFSDQSSNDIFEVKGIANDKGQTVAIRSEVPITIRNVRVSRRIVSGNEFSGPDGLDSGGISHKLSELAAGKDAMGATRVEKPPANSGGYKGFHQKKGGYEGYSLFRWSDSGGVYKVPYRMELCSGAFIEDISDDMGWTVFYDKKNTPDCPVTYWIAW